MPIVEVAITNSVNDDQILLWDIRTLTVLSSYKQCGKSSPHGLALLGPHHLACAQQNKNSMRFWKWASDQPEHKMGSPENLPVIASTSDGQIVVGGSASGKIYFWQVATGALLRIIDAHFRNVSVLKFTDDDSCLVSGGADGMVHVWSLNSVLLASSTAEPTVSLTGHSLPITDICCGYGLDTAHITTVSLDRTCKIWDLSSGSLLSSIVFPSGLTSVVVDPGEFNLYVGCVDGRVFQSNIHSISNFGTQQESQMGEELVYHGHSDSISRLGLSFDANILISCSKDGTAIVWDVLCRQKLKTFSKHTGAISNLIITTKPTTMLTEKYHVFSSCISNFDRYLKEKPDGLASGQLTPIVDTPVYLTPCKTDKIQKPITTSLAETPIEQMSQDGAEMNSQLVSARTQCEEMEEKLKRTQHLNSMLYQKLVAKS